MALLTDIKAYFKFDEVSGNPQDSVGSNNLSNGYTGSWVAGKINNAFQGAGASLLKTNATSIPGAQNTGGDLTVSFWFRTDSVIDTDYERVLVILGDTWGFANGVSWGIQQHKVGTTQKLDFFTSSDGTTIHHLLETQSLTVGTWYYIVVTYTASTHIAEIFVNGSSLGSGSVTDTSLFSTTGPLWVMSGYVSDAGYGQNTEGTIDELGIWSRVLSGTEISALYNGGAGFQYPFSTAVLSPAALLGLV